MFEGYFGMIFLLLPTKLNWVYRQVVTSGGHLTKPQVNLPIKYNKYKTDQLGVCSAAAFARFSLLNFCIKMISYWGRHGWINGSFEMLSTFGVTKK